MSTGSTIASETWDPQNSLTGDVPDASENRKAAATNLVPLVDAVEGPETADIPCPLHAAALATPDAPAILRAAGATTYGDLDNRVSAAAGKLAESGCAPGARVGLYLEKDERYIVLLLALLRAGCVACPVSTRMPVEGVPALLRVAGCLALISDQDLSSATKPVVLRPDDLLREAPRTPRPRAGNIPTDRPTTIVFTSGSTGSPKAALHTFGNHYYSALGSGANIPLAPGDRWLHTLPLYHVGGLSVIFRCLLSGAAISLPDPRAPLGEEIARYRATHVSLVATQLQRLLSEDVDLSSLKAVLLGGGPVPETLVDEAAARKLPIHTSYGLTETASQVTTTPPGASSEELYASGRVLPHREVSISGDGEVLVRGATLFAGYVRGDELDHARDAGGWFHTKDLGALGADGSLRVWGRKDNLFISGGENIQPEEIEDALAWIEGVERAVVVPVPDAEFGERPVAFVQTSSSVPGTLDLTKDLEPVLPRFKIPVAFYSWPADAPEGMKPDREFLRQRARELRDVDRG